MTRWEQFRAETWDHKFTPEKKRKAMDLYYMYYGVQLELHVTIVIASLFMTHLFRGLTITTTTYL